MKKIFKILFQRAEYGERIFFVVCYNRCRRHLFDSDADLAELEKIMERMEKREKFKVVPKKGK